MKPLLPAHRAAEDFARALDGTADRAVADRYRDLVATATLLREQPLPVARPEFVASLRAELMRAAETELVPAAPAPVAATAPTVRRHTRRERHLGAAAAALVLVGSTAGVAAAADDSLPGSALYPIKRGFEQLQAAMNTRDSAKGGEYLSQASTRLAEVRRLIADEGSPAQINNTLTDFNSRATQGADLLFASYQSGQNDADIAAVRDFATDEMAQLRTLAADAPVSTAVSFSEAAALLAALDQQARVLCAACSPLQPVSAPAALASPSLTSAMASLVVTPASRAAQSLRRVSTPSLPSGLKGAAEAAEEQAKNTPPAGSPPHGPRAGIGSVDNPLGTDTSGTTGSSLPINTKKPVSGLVDSITSNLPLPEAVLSTTKPLTDGVTKILDDTLSGLLPGQR